MRAQVSARCALAWTLFVTALAVIAVNLLAPQTSIADEGRRIPAKVSAQSSASGYGAELAVDGNDATLWVASLSPRASNNSVWFQLDLGKTRQVARLHWLAANGTPYPASAPKRYKVMVSADGTSWRTVTDTVTEGSNEPVGDVLLNTAGRYVRLETSQINDGTGWSLGLREIWVTEGRDTSSSSRWELRARMADDRIGLAWQKPAFATARTLKIYRSTVPTDDQGTLIASLDTARDEYVDTVPNWTPYYYRVQAVDSKGNVLGTSSKAAAFAHPVGKEPERVETFAFWYEAYKPSTYPDSTIKYIGNAPFVAGLRKEAAGDLKKFGIGVLPYITLYQTADWTAKFPTGAAFSLVESGIAPFAFYKSTAHFKGSPPGYVPTVFRRPGSIEYDPAAIQYTTCPNSVPFREKVFDFVSKQLAGGVYGFFVDNGYQDDIAASSVCQSTAHRHYYGDQLKSADAFIGMLMEMTCAVKKQNPNGMVIVNGGVPDRAEFYGLKLNDVMDGQLWESYLRSSHNTSGGHVFDWASVYKRSVEVEKAWFLNPPKRMFVLSYPWNRDEAFLCYATAKLTNLPWSANLGKADPEHKEFGGHFGAYPELIDLRLGLPENLNQFGGEKLGEVYVRHYQKGFVVVNPTDKVQKTTLPFSGRAKYYDVYAGKYLADKESVVLLSSESGRVYIYK